MEDSVTVDGVEHDFALSNSEILSRQEVLRRRSRRVKQLARLYRAHYWNLMEELKRKHKEYYWVYGKSPFKQDENNKTSGKDNDGKQLGLGFHQLKCRISDCKERPMALTTFCQRHILNDSKQMLYRGCSFRNKSGQMCKKPVLRSINPPHCPTHSQASEKYLMRALRNAGLNNSSPSNLAPKLHVIVTEYVRHIQAKRRVIQQKAVSKTKIEDIISDS